MATLQQSSESPTAEESFVIMAPPGMPDSVSEGKYPHHMEHDSDLEVQERGLVSNTPSTAVPPTPQIQLNELLVMMSASRIENNELRNHLNELNLVVQHKSKSLEQIMQNYRQYDENVKEKYKQTSVRFSNQRAENLKLTNENELLLQEKNKLEELVEGINRDRQAEGDQVEMKINNESPGKQEKGINQSQTDLEQQLQRERQRCKELILELNKRQDSEQKTERKLKTSFADLAKLRDEKRKDLQELRGAMDREINNYKEQITTLLSELTEKKRSLELHKQKVQELHEANQQFDEVNTAYHAKLGMYEEALKDKDVEMTKFRGSVRDQMTAEHRRTEKLGEELQKSQQYCEDTQRRLEGQLHKKRSSSDSQLARMVSMEESLEVRDNTIKEFEESKQLLTEQLNQYQTDFESERRAREHFHQQNQSLVTELTQCKKERDKLQSQVDEYAESQMIAFRNRFHPPSPEFTPPSPEYQGPLSPGFGQFNPTQHSNTLPYGGLARGYDTDEQHRHQSRNRERINRGPSLEEEAGETTEHKCPMCNESFSEMQSLEIHVQQHF